MSNKDPKIIVYQVFDNPEEQKAHRNFLRASSHWNTITAIILIILFWLYQHFVGININNAAH